jgi:hypothetical protein
VANARYGEKTSKEGEYRPTGSYTYQYTVQGNRNVPQHYKEAQGIQYTWFPKQETAAPAQPAPQQAPPPPKPEPKKPEPVKHSPEIKQAKERVNKYQNDVLSGKVSEQIYGKSNETFNKSNTGFLDKYQMNLNQ